jgi:hypothetical protein
MDQTKKFFHWEHGFSNIILIKLLKSIFFTVFGSHSSLVFIKQPFSTISTRNETSNSFCRVEIISDFPDGNDAEIISSLRYFSQ